MHWVDAHSRAVFPNPELDASAVPVRGTRELAAQSPLPYGLGLYQRNEAGAEIGQDMYYVSPEVAKARGRGVLPGWYVVATPGTEFTLRLTNVHASGKGKVWDKFIDARFGACVEVLVDGANVIGGIAAYQVSPAGEEMRISGFLESETFPAGQRRGNSTVRVFRFRKIQPSANVSSEEDQCAGSMCLRIHSGPLRPNTYSATYRSNPLVPKVSEVNEKSASKLGRSVRVEKHGATAYDPVHRTAYSVTRTKMDGEVRIFMRERYWLESRSIIDKEGNAFKPRRFSEVINLDGDEEDDTNNNDDDEADDDIEVVYVKKATVVKQEDEVEKPPPGQGATTNMENTGDGEFTKVGNVAMKENIPDHPTDNVSVQKTKRLAVSKGTKENMVEAHLHNNSPSEDNPANPTQDALKAITLANDPKSPKTGSQKEGVVGKPHNNSQSGSEKRANVGEGEVRGAGISLSWVKAGEENEPQSDDEDDGMEITEMSMGDGDEENEGSANGTPKKRKRVDSFDDEIKVEDEMVRMRAKKRVLAEAEAEEGSPTKRAQVADVSPTQVKGSIDLT